MEQINHKKYPRVLIISNNPLSDKTNNGKTIASLFKGYPPEKIHQIYFSPEEPSGTPIGSYYQLTDKEMVNAFFSKTNKPGKEKKIYNKGETKETSTPKVKIPKNNMARIAREFIWKNKRWKTKELVNWLDDFSPNIIFLVAGDFGFSYDITNYIQKKFNAKLVTYVTDDYILPRKTLNILWWIRRDYIQKKMKSVVTKSDIFITISEKMKKMYKKEFSKDSLVIMNVTDSLVKTKKITEHKKYIKLIYAGGLHFKRYLVLESLGKALHKINNTLEPDQLKFKLFIYTNSTPSKRILKKINIKGASVYGGSLNSEELIYELNNSDIPVHVESFDKKSIESTRLSISTKISEYLSLSKPILAIGPSDVASMEFLQGIAFCINREDRIEENLPTFLFNKNLHVDLSNKSRDYYLKNDMNNMNEKFKGEIVELVDK